MFIEVLEVSFIWRVLVGRLHVVGGTRLVGTVTTRSNLDGISSGGTLRTFFSSIAGTLSTNSGVSLIKFNAFSMTRESTEVKVGPSAGGTVRVPTGGITGFGPNTRLASTVGWTFVIRGGLERRTL